MLLCGVMLAVYVGAIALQELRLQESSLPFTTGVLLLPCTSKE